MSASGPNRVLGRKAAEIALGSLFALAGCVMISGARELDTGWSGSGPEAGYFPLRIGIILTLVSLAIVVREALRGDPGRPLITLREARKVVAFLLPIAACLALIPLLGIYLAAAAYLFAAIGPIGRAGYLRAAIVAVACPAFLFVMFEHLFHTPLPKGPLGPLLGLF
jgi:hypothetical protein